MTQTVVQEESITALKFVPRVARHWTPSTGAASQRITGFGRHLAPRYTPQGNTSAESI